MNENLRKKIEQAEYMCGAPHWETKRRWDIQRVLGEALKMMETKELERNSPYLRKLGVRVYDSEIPCVAFEELYDALDKAGISKGVFNEFFGVQTCCYTPNGKEAAYWYDVEAVLVRMISGKFEGTQLFWD